ncbi:MAG: class I SAM-dependent methyltransferase [Patescibacteria group bacterium]
MQALLVVIYVLVVIAALVSVTGIIIWEWSLAFTDAPFVPIPPDVLPHIVAALELTDGSNMYDLGSGDGRVLFSCWANRSGASYVGIDIALAPTWFARWRRYRLGNPDAIRILRRDILTTDLSNATHVFTYLFPGLMEKLLPKLQRELKLGTRLVSCDFPFTHKEPVKVIDLQRPERSRGRKLYVYQF